MFGGKTLNLKVIIAVLIAVTMVVPCAAAMESTTAGAVEEPSGLALGDAWGIEYSGDKDDLIELLLDGEEVPAEYLEMYNAIHSSIEKANMDAALIIEVIRADESGYTISVDGGILIEVSVEFDDEIEIGDGTYGLNADASLKAVIVFQGLVNLDAEYNITSVDVTIDAYIDAKLTTNFSIMNYIELMNDETGEIGPAYVFTETDNTSELMAGASIGYSMYSAGESGVTTIEDLGDVAYVLTLDGKHSVNASVFANIDGEIAEALIYMMPEDSDYGDFIIDEDTIQASMTMGDTVMTDMEISLDAEQNGVENEDGTFEYAFDIEGLHLGTETLLPSDLPYFETLADVDVDPEFEYYLDSTEKSEVRGTFNKILSAYNGSASDLKFTVTYVVDEVETTQTVGFNKFVNPPAVPDKTVGENTMKCVGWMTEDGLEWNAGWGVKGDLTLYPVYAEEFTNVSDLIAYMKSDPTVPAYGYIRIDGVADLADFLGSGNFEFNGTMYVDVYDDDGKYLFSWTIYNDGTPLDPSTVMDLNIAGGELTDEELEKLSESLISGETSFMYIDFAASGLMPGKTTVTYNVGDKFADGTVLQIYYVITDGDGNIIGLEPVRNATVVDGKVTFDLDHCSSYVLSAISVPDSEDDNTMLYIGIAVAAIIIIAVAAVLLLRRSRSGSA